MKNLETGVYSTEDLRAIYGSNVGVVRARDRGDIVPVIRGYYSTPGMDDVAAQMAIISKYHPNVVLSGLAVLFHYGLVDYMGDEISFDVDPGSNYREMIGNFRFHRTNKIVGVTTDSVQGYPVKVYNIHRALCEVLGVDTINGQYYRTVIKNYVNHPEADIAALPEYTRMFGDKGLELLRDVQLVMTSKDIY